MPLSTHPKIIWPEKKNFAFTIFDDTDHSTVENTKPIYDFLNSIGIKTTKSVWAANHKDRDQRTGCSLQDKEYRIFIQELANKGFEISLHLNAGLTSTREETIKGLKFFKEVVGYYPKSLTNHDQNLEGIYWGEARFTGLNKFLYRLANLKKLKRFQGHEESSPLFWGDQCCKNITYVRNFSFTDTNILKKCDKMPYYDPERPYVNFWFASTNGSTIDRFNQALSEKNQDLLEAQSGLCLISTHFAKGFTEEGKINPQFKTLMKRLVKKKGWFVPVHQILDFLRKEQKQPEISTKDRFCLEASWLFQRIISR